MPDNPTTSYLAGFDTFAGDETIINVELHNDNKVTQLYKKYFDYFPTNYFQGKHLVIGP